ncbi:MAG: hypothetical protein R3C53_16955 [Pirellulaceae bacterium]
MKAKTLLGLGFLLAATLFHTDRAMGGLIANAIVRDGVNVLDSDASMAPLIVSANAEWTNGTDHEQALVNGGSSPTRAGLIAFSFYNALETPLYRLNQYSEASLGWEDSLQSLTLNNGTVLTSGSALLTFRVHGEINIVDDGTDANEYWDFSARSLNPLNIADVYHDASLSATHPSGIGGPDFFGIPSWDNFIFLSPNEFIATTVIPVTIGTSMSLRFQSNAFSSGEAQILADLSNTVTLESVALSTGELSQSASFESGLSFQALSAVPEPSSLATISLAFAMSVVTRRQRPTVNSR